ncbi:hypothetical protein CRG98_017201 [Punica granatum]|uniref:Uncharacterized protein n=1 Tax=Punica granatum TaxID=22663 RepID=A0A2I0K1F7_PUNGR|nr:hypothetical protein CRG98_017201 [Punica granatum]
MGIIAYRPSEILHVLKRVTLSRTRVDSHYAKSSSEAAKLRLILVRSKCGLIINYLLSSRPTEGLEDGGVEIAGGGADGLDIEDEVGAEVVVVAAKEPVVERESRSSSDNMNDTASNDNQDAADKPHKDWR